jgi:hypothetical protein
VTVFIAAMSTLSRDQKRKSLKLEHGKKQWRARKGQARKANHRFVCSVQETLGSEIP